MNFTDVKFIKIGTNNVTKIVDSSNNILWSQEITFNIISNDADFNEYIDASKPETIKDTVKAKLGSKIEDIASQSSILSAMNVDPTNHCYEKEDTINGVRTIFTIDGSENIDNPYINALKSTDVINQSYIDASLYIVRAS